MAVVVPTLSVSILTPMRDLKDLGQPDLLPRKVEHDCHRQEVPRATIELPCLKRKMPAGAFCGSSSCRRHRPKKAS